jgi:hypothetical protein
LKRGWTRFWASVSLLFSLGAVGAVAQTKSLRKPVATARAAESRLAGIVPGQTTLTRATALLGPPRERDANSSSVRWSHCSDDLILETNSAGRIQTIRATRHLGQQPTAKCLETISATKWATGKGLRLGNSATRAVQIYGTPDSRSPSTKGGQQLELLYYAFDWVGPDVPQVMEVVCTVGKEGEPGRVVEITLAASSL